MPEDWTLPGSGGNDIDPMSWSETDQPCDVTIDEPGTVPFTERSGESDCSAGLGEVAVEPDAVAETDRSKPEHDDESSGNGNGDDAGSQLDSVPEIGNDVAMDDLDVDDEPVILEIEGVAGDEASLEVVEEEPEELAAIREELASLQTTHDQLREQYLRKLAEFDNYRKRTEREREELERTGGVGVVRELVPVLDNFERALQHSDNSDSAAFRQGVEMIAKQLWDVLGRQGLEEMDPTGQPFQPEYHEAVQRVEDSDQEPGTVAWVLAKGYLFGGRLIRPAMVGVAVEPSQPEMASENPETEGGEGLDAQ